MFTYALERGSNRGYIYLYEGEPWEESSDEMLYLTKEKDLLKALKIYEKTAILASEKSPEVLTEGERLAKKLNFPFQHP